MITALLVDDEPVICEELRYLLEEENNVKVLGICNSANEAWKRLKNKDLTPDLIFLDILMPGISGLDLAQKLSDLEKPSYIVFVTAYKDYALEAHKFNTVDYILKPFDSEDIAKVVNKISKMRSRAFNVQLQQLANYLKNPQSTVRPKICGEKNGRLDVLDPSDIVMVYSEKRIIYIKTDNANYSTNLTLQQLEDELKNYNFFRCHRKYIVNLNKIRQVIPWFNGTYLLALKDKENTEISVSRSFVKDLKEIIKF